MKNWAIAQYRDIKGNAKWALIVALWWVITAIGKKVLQMIPNIPEWLVWVILLLLSLVVFIWVTKSVARSGKLVANVQPITPQPPGIPTVSALQGQTPQVKFDAKEMFRRSYFSPVTAEIENNIKIVAAQNSPNDHEAFYARFIGVGLVAYLHDMTWSTIFNSQILTLQETMSRSGWLPLNDAKTFYDKAVAEYPKIYQNYSFDQWLAYMQGEQLIIKHPSNMLEITHRGNDFLKYLAHWGRKVEAKLG